MIDRLLIRSCSLFVVILCVACETTLIVYDPYIAESYLGDIQTETKDIFATMRSGPFDISRFLTRSITLRDKNNLLYPIQQMSMHHADTVIYFSSYRSRFEMEMQRFQSNRQKQYVQVHRNYEGGEGDPPAKEGIKNAVQAGSIYPSQQSVVLDRREALEKMIHFIVSALDEQVDSVSPAVVVFRTAEGIAPLEYDILKEQLFVLGVDVVQELLYTNKETMIGRMIRDINVYKETPYFLFFVGSSIIDIRPELSNIDGEIFVESFFIESAQHLGATMSIGFSLKDIITYSILRDRDKDSIYVPAIFHRY